MDLGAASLCSRAICRYMATSSGLRDTRQLLLNQQGSCTKCVSKKLLTPQTGTGTQCASSPHGCFNTISRQRPHLHFLACLACSNAATNGSLHSLCVCGQPNSVNVMTPPYLRAAERGTHRLDDALDVRASQVVTKAVLCKAIQVQVTECKHIQPHRQTDIQQH